MGAKTSKGIRSKGILWEYDGDGQYAQEKYMSADKKFWNRWKRHRSQKELKEHVDDYERS